MTQDYSGSYGARGQASQLLGLNADQPDSSPSGAPTAAVTQLKKKGLGKKILGAVSDVANTDFLPGVDAKDVMHVANYPLLKPLAEEARKHGVVGRVAGSVLETVTPLTVGGAFLGGEGLAVNLLGRGALSVPKYGTLLAASGAGAGIGKEVGGTPGEIAGGLAGGWAALTKGNNAEQDLVRAAGEGMAEDARVAKTNANAVAEELSKGNWKQLTLADGTTAQAVTTTGLADQIRGREARLFKLTQDGTALPDYLHEFEDTTKALSDLHDWMTTTGRAEVPMVDAYASARHFATYRDASASSAEWLVRSTEASRRAGAIQEAMDSMPGYHLVDQGATDMGTIFRGYLNPDAELALQNNNQLRQQLIQSKQTLDAAGQGVAAAKLDQAAHLKGILDSMPTGAKTAGRDYLSALIRGDQEAIDVAGQKLQAKLPSDRTIQPPIPPSGRIKKGRQAPLPMGTNDQQANDLFQQFQDALTKHQGRSQLEAAHADLAQSHQDLLAQFQAQRQASELPIKASYGGALAEMSRKIFQPEGKRSLYRSAGLVDQDGQLFVNLEKLQPAKDAKEAVQAGAELDVANSKEISDAQDGLNELLAKRSAAQKTGATRDQLHEFRVQIDEARAQVDRLRTPARPIAADMLPNDPNRLLVPLTDTSKFQVWEPAAKTSSTVTGDLRSAQTVSMLNKQTRTKLELDSLGNDMAKLDAQAAKINRVAPTDSEQVLLQQGITDGIRPEVIDGLQQQAQINEQRQILQGQIDAKTMEGDALDSRVLRSQQALTATLEDANYQAEFAKQQHADALALADKSWGNFSDSLRLPPTGIALQQAENFKNVNDYVLAHLDGKLGNKRLSQSAFDSLLQDIETAHERTRQTFPRGFQDEFDTFLKPLEGIMPSMGARAAIRQMATPFSGAVRNLDPDAMRSGIGGFVRRVVMGTGFKSREFEGGMSSALANQQTSGLTADIVYHGFKLKVAKLVDALATKAGDVAINTFKDPEEKLRAYIGRASHGIDSTPWTKMFDKLADYGLTEAEKQDLYDHFHDVFAFAGLNTHLYDWTKMDKVATMVTHEFGNQLKGLQKVADSTALVSPLVKSKYRQFFDPSRMFPPLGNTAEAGVIKAGGRSFLTDALALKRNAEASLGRAVPLSEMFIPKADFEKTLASNYLNRVGNKATYDYFGSLMRDPSQANKLARGEPVSTADWLKPEYAQDWAKAKEMLQGVTGPWASVQEASKWMQRVASSVLLGDLGFMSIQMPLAMSISPVTGGRAVMEAVKAYSDEGFHSWAIDNWDKLQFRVQHGMGVGHESVFGQNSTGNIYQSIPGLKKVGNAIQGLDNYTFGRVQMMNKMRYIDTLEHDVGLIKTLGKDVGQAYIDGIPVLADLHNKTDIWQATNEELENQFIRLANNAIGGVPRSQTLLGARRQAVESTLLMVPGFFRARAGLINQVGRALVNPKSPEGYLAASILAREAAFRMTIAGGIAAATGTLPEFQKEIESGAAFDPRQSGGMLKSPLGDGGYLGLSWGNAAPKLYAQMLAGFSSGEFNLAPADRLKAIQTFFEGRENPAIATAIDQIRGSDFFGRPLKSPQDRVVNMLQAVAPTWVGQGVSDVSEQLKKDGHIDPVALGADTGTQFLGLNMNPGRPYDKLNNQFHAWQLDHFQGQTPLDWNQAPSDMKRMAKTAVPDLTSAENDYIYDQNRRANGAKIQSNAAFTQYDGQNHDLDARTAEATARVNAGQMNLAQWKENYSGVQEDKADASDYLSKRLASLGIDLSKLSADKAANLDGKAPPVVTALIAYRQIRPQDYLVNNQRITDGGPVLDQDIDWAAFKKARETALAQFPETVQKEVTQYLEPPDPIAQRLTQARSDMDTYFDKIPKYNGLAPDEGKYVDFVLSSLRALDGQILSSGAQASSQSIYAAALQQLQASGRIQTTRQQQLAATAYRMAIDPAFALQQRNPTSLKWLLDHPDSMRFYPWLEADVPNRLKPLLPRDITAADIGAIARSRLQGVDVSQIQ